MLKKRHFLPPLDYFVAFEAAAKLGSFAKATKLLNISETAISRKVRLLEQHYDLPFFVRGHRSIALTQQGKELLSAVESSLDVLREASQELFSKNGANSVALAATNSVASLWLMPRLRKFNHANKQVKIMLMASDSDSECLSDTMDLSILRGEGNWPGFDATLLFGETIFPVCSPKFLEQNPNCVSIEALPALDLIEVQSSHTEWMNWKEWLGRLEVHDVALERAAYFNTFPLATQAAVDGLGVALGWGHLVDHLLRAGDLVRPLGAAQTRTESGYYLLKNQREKPFPEQHMVEEWLLGISAARNRYS
jgi:LysR family glycine cleavage system transcriptional activator